MKRRCSLILFCSLRFVSPTYWDWHFRHVIRYTTLGVKHEILQLYLVLMVVPIADELAVFDLSNLMQYLQQIFGQVVFLGGTGGLLGGGGGYLILLETSRSFRFFCLLKAPKGASGNIFPRVLAEDKIGQYLWMVCMTSGLLGL